MIKNQTGNSVVEFLVFAPIVSLMLFMAHDTNSNIYEKQQFGIEARNSLFVKNLNGDYYQKLITSNIVNNLHGQKVDLTVNQIKDKSVIGDRIITNSNNIPVIDMFIQQFNEASKNQVSFTLDGLMLSSPLYDQPLLEDQQVYSVILDNTQLKEESEYRESLSSLIEMVVGGKKEFATKGEAVQFFYNGDSGFHSDKLAQLGEYSLAMTSTEMDLYGIAPVVSSDLYFQTYCMSNIAANGSCGYTDFAYLNNEKDYATQAHQIATSILDLSLIMDEASLNNLSATTSGVSAAAISANEAILFQQVKPIYESIPDADTNGMDQLLQMDSAFPFPQSEQALYMKGAINLRGHHVH